MSSVKCESLTSPWPTWMPFISLCCLIAEAKISNTMLNNSGESGHPCLVPDLRGKALSVSPLRMILVLGRSYMAFTISRYATSIPTFLRVFYQERMLYFVKCFLCIYWEDHIVLVLSFIDVMNHVNCFVDIEPALHLKNESHLIVVNNSFNALLDLVC